MWSASMWLVITIRRSQRLLAAQLVDPRLQDRVVDAGRSAVDQHAHRRSGGGLLVVQEQAVAVVGLQRFEREQHGELLSDRLQWRAGRPPCPRPWKRGSRPRSVAVLHRISLTRRGWPISSRWRPSSERRRAAHVRRRHAGAVHRLVVAVERARIDALARRDEVRLRAAVAGRTAARKIRDAVVVRHRAVRRADRDDAVGVARIGDADVAVVADGAALGVLAACRSRGCRPPSPRPRRWRRPARIPRTPACGRRRSWRRRAAPTGSG